MVSSALVRPFRSLPSLLFILAVGTETVRAQQLPSSVCSDVHLFLARGNEEAYPGRIGALVDTTCGGLENVSCDYEDIQFTSIDGSVYCNSIAQGIVNGIAQITAYNKHCPNTKLVLGGYSEGAHIVGDILGGGGGDFYDCVEGGNQGLNPSYAPGNMIVAAAIFGDPRHTAGESYNVGNGSGDEGEYPRSGSQLAALNLFSANLQSYCIFTDPICALGNDGLSHTTYMTLYASTAGAWIQKMASSSGATGSAAAASKASAAAAASSAAVVSASKAAVAASSAAAAASAKAKAASAAAASASGVSASVSAASVASVASESAASAAAAASSASARVASVSVASVSQASASVASVASESQASASLASQTPTTTYAYPSDVGLAQVTSKPTAQQATSAAQSSTTTSASANGASRPTNLGWYGSLAVAVVMAVAVRQ